MKEHGARSRYQHDACRCVECTTANTDYCAAERRARMLTVSTGGLPESVAHGLSAYKNWGCRCPVCTEANSDSTRAYREANPGLRLAYWREYNRRRYATKKAEAAK